MPTLPCPSPEPKVFPTPAVPGSSSRWGPESWRYLHSSGGMSPWKLLFLLLLGMEEKHAYGDVLLPCLEIPRKGHKSAVLAQGQCASGAEKCMRSWKMR